MCAHLPLHIDAIQSYFPEYFGQDIEVFEVNTGYDSSQDTQLDPQQEDGQEDNEGGTLILKLDCGHFLH